MTLRLFIPADAGALAVGAEEVAGAIGAAAARHKVAVEIVRTGSRGLYWLEPMVEVETPGGRIAYGPVEASDIPEMLAKGLLTGAAQRLHQPVGMMHALGVARDLRADHTGGVVVVLRAAHAADRVVAENLDLKRAGRWTVVRAGGGGNARTDGLVHVDRTLPRSGRCENAAVTGRDSGL